MTSLKLREKGYQILFEHLGQIDSIRFLQEFDWGHGDYTQERSNILNPVTRDEFWADIAKIRNAKKTKN
jgi:hypothetical protein